MTSGLFRDLQDRGLRVASKIASRVVSEPTTTGWADWERRTFAAVQACIVNNDSIPHTSDAVARAFNIIDGFPEFHQQRLRQLLAVIEAAPLIRFRKRFTELDFRGQTTVLDSWANSRIAARRAAFHGLKSISMLGFWTGPQTWGAVGYSLVDNPGVPARLR